MEDKKEHCEQLLRNYKNLIPRIPAGSPGSGTPEINSNREERDVLAAELKKECWEYLNDSDRRVIE